MVRGKARPKLDDDGPEVSVVEGPAGRETLALIADLARPARGPQSTLDYSDRIANAPGSKTPSRVPASFTEPASRSAQP